MAFNISTAKKVEPIDDAVGVAPVAPQTPTGRFDINTASPMPTVAPEGRERAQDIAAQYASHGGAWDNGTPISDELMPASHASPTEGYADLMGTVGDAIASNADIPGGIAGAMGGAKLGSLGGPVGALAGTILGGASGTFGGSLLSSWYESDEMDFNDATKEAALSAGIDVATLGAGKYLKPLAKVLGANTDDFLRTLYNYTQNVPSTKIQGVNVPTAGDLTSLRHTQDMLQTGLKDESGNVLTQGSLTAYQTGQSTGAKKFAETLAQTGILSGPVYSARAKNNAEVIGANLKALMNEGVETQIDDVGHFVLGVVHAGKKAAGEQYGKTMAEATQQFGSAQVPLAGLKDALTDFRAAGQHSWGSTYNSETLKVLNEFEAALGKQGNLSLDSLTAFQRSVNNTISDLGAFGANSNPRAARDLAKLGDQLRTAVHEAVEGQSPKAAELIKRANQEYSYMLSTLTPELNANVVANATKGKYQSLANVLSGSDADQAKAFMKSIRTSYNQAEVRGLPFAVEGVKTAAEAESIVRQHYLKNIFGEVSGSFDPHSFAKLHADYSKGPRMKAAKEVLGNKGYVQFRRLLNAMNEVSQKQGMGPGALVLRGKEAQAAGAVASAGVQMAGMGGGAVAAGMGMGPGLPIAGAILTTPLLLAKIVSSPKAVDVLIDGIKKAPGKGGLRVETITKAIEALGTTAHEEILNNLSEE